MPENAVRLRRALSKLSQEERLICIWKIAGFSTGDIAEQTGRSEGTVNSMFENARSKLRRHLRISEPGGQEDSDDETHHDS